MQKIISLKLQPAEAASEPHIKRAIAQSEGVPDTAISGFLIIKQSIDARAKQPWIHLALKAFINESPGKRETLSFPYRDTRNSLRKVIIIGAGPAGLFAGLKLIEAGIKPIILERGKDVRSRRRDLALLNKEGYQITTASDGIEAMVKAIKELPFLMILEVGLPKIYGFEVCFIAIIQIPLP